MSQNHTTIALALTIATLACLSGCGDGQTPGGGPAQRPSDGDPNVTRLPEDVRAMYDAVMEAQVKPGYKDMTRALAANDRATISDRARAIIKALGKLEREHGRCPVEFVKLHRRFRDSLSSVLEFSDGSGDMVQLKNLLGENGRVGKACDDCHGKYIEH